MFEILTLVQTDKLSKKIDVILYGSEYWNQVLNFKPMAEWGAIADEDLSLLHPADTRKSVHAWSLIAQCLPAPQIDRLLLPLDRLATDEELRLVHDQDYLDRLAASPFVADLVEVPLIGVAPFPLLDKFLLTPMRAAVRGTMLACEAALCQPLPEEPTRLALVSGRDFLGLKGIVEAILARFHLEDALEVRPSPASWFTPGRSAELLLSGTSLGRMGEIDRARLDALDVRGACSAAELTLGVLVDRADLVPRHHAMPTLPAVARDLSLLVPRSLPWSELAGVAGRAGGPMLESIVYLDAFRGGNVPEDRQSIHFGLRFRHPERTLTGDEVEKAVQAIVEACASRFEATLR